MFSKRQFLPLALLLVAASSGCHTTRNVLGGIRDVHLSAAETEGLEEVVVLLAENADDLDVSGYKAAAALVSQDRRSDWLNFFQLTPDGDGWSLHGEQTLDDYLRFDKEGVDPTRRLSARFQVEFKNLGVEQADAGVLILAFYNDSTETLVLDTSALSFGKGEIDVAIKSNDISHSYTK